jgi:hypothetical protein
LPPALVAASVTLAAISASGIAAGPGEGTAAAGEEGLDGSAVFCSAAMAETADTKKKTAAAADITRNLNSRMRAESARNKLATNPNGENTKRGKYIV